LLGGINVDPDNYTREASETSWLPTVIFVALLFTIWGATLVNIPDVANIAAVNMFMVVGALCLAIAAYISSAICGKAVFPFGVFGFPKLDNVTYLVLSIFAGASAGYLYTLIGGGIASFTQTFDVVNPFLALPPLFLFLLYGIAAPGAEEVLFRATVLPIMLRIGANFKNQTISLMGVVAAVALNAFFWSVVHYYTFGGSLSFILTAFVFGLVVCVLTVAFKSAVPAITAHIVYNSKLVLDYLSPTINFSINPSLLTLLIMFTVGGFLIFILMKR